MVCSHPKTARTDHEVLDLIERRWSPRAFDPAKDVSQAELLRLFEAARWAPSVGQRAAVAIRRRRRARRSPEAFAALLSSLNGEESRVGGSGAGARAGGRASDARARREPPNARSAWYDAGQAVGVPDAAGHRDGAVRPADGRLRPRARARGVRRARRLRAGRRHGDRLRGRSGHVVDRVASRRPSASRGRAGRSPTFVFDGRLGQDNSVPTRASSDSLSRASALRASRPADSTRRSAARRRAQRANRARADLVGRRARGEFAASAHRPAPAGTASASRASSDSRCGSRTRRRCRAASTAAGRRFAEEAIDRRARRGATRPASGRTRR